VQRHEPMHLTAGSGMAVREHERPTAKPVNSGRSEGGQLHRCPKGGSEARSLPAAPGVANRSRARTIGCLPHGAIFVFRELRVV
jgi:hypothetical protein